VIQLHKNNNIQYLVGGNSISTQPLVPFDELVCEFLNDLSKELRIKTHTNRLSDVISFSFWCRKANILKLKNEIDDGKIRIGLGLVLHITPSNVPTNFAYSFVFGLLSGNANIVKLPSVKFEQINIICQAVEEILDENKYITLKQMNVVIKYDKNDEITNDLSEKANARVIWGGDSTIKNIKNYQTPLRSVDLTFTDRYSLCVINSDEILKMSEKNLNILGSDFYNDTYLMDQNACSSQHLILWLGHNTEVAMEKFWLSVYKTAKQRYELQTISALEKYNQLCNDSLSLEHIRSCKKYDNLVYLIRLSNLPYDISKLRGKCGYFYEYKISELNHIAEKITNKIQTVTYCGIDKSDLINFVKNNRLNGIDRIVPIGKAFDMSVYWDGYNVLNSLSRIIEVA